MKNYPCYYDAAAARCYPGGDAGEAPAATTAGDTCSFADLIAGYSTDDLFELAWERGEAGGASTTMQPLAASCRRLWSPELEVMRSCPPSEVEMAAWLCAIFRGDEEELVAVDEQVTAGRDELEERERPPSDNTSSSTTTTGKKEKLPTIGSIKQAPGKLREALALGGFPRRSHHGQAHKLTEKRRRHKIKEMFRTLQQLVPGCDDKSNQAATLDKTIQYMKSLQQHIQAMSDGGAARRPTAVYPVVPPVVPAAMPMQAAPTMVLATAPAMMVVPLPLGGMLQLPHYPAPAVPFMTVPGGAGSSSSCGHRHGSSRKKANNKGGSIRSLRQKH